MNEKTLLCMGRTYRGVMINSFPTGEAFVYNKNEERYDFASISEAQAFVDACYAISMTPEVR